VLKQEHITIGAGSTLGTGSAVMSDAVRVGDLLLLSGRAPIDPATMRLVSQDFTEQAEAVLRDVEAVLAAAGATLDQVVRVECFLADAADFQTWNRIWCERFQPPRPARTTVVTGFAVPGMLVELQVTAALETSK
jgi:2-iminobutanoate/2-iminopropanoate deaminase